MMNLISKLRTSLITGALLSICMHLHAADVYKMNSEEERPSLPKSENQSALNAIAESLYSLSTTKPAIRDQRVKSEREPRLLNDVSELYSNLDPVKLKLHIELTHGDVTRTLDRTVMRTSEQVYMNYEDQGQEWLFEKNPLDKRRVSGRLIDHRQEYVLQYHDSELHNFGIVSGWADVVSLGVNSNELEGLQSTGQVEEFEGVQFLHFASESEDDQKPAIEIWWAENHALPFRIIRRSGDKEWKQEITSMHWILDQNLLAKPGSRFPEYESMDYVDWQEEYHETHEGQPHHGHNH